MSKHTPGPWEFLDNSLVGPKIDDKPVWLRPVILRSETGVAKADANLIAAAPDLLEALETLVRNGTRSTLEDWEAAMVAIAKARGEV